MVVIKINKRVIIGKILPLFLVMLFLSAFMGYRGIEYTNIVYICLFACFAMFCAYLGIRHYKKYSSPYDLSIIAFIVIIYLSFIPGAIWGGQSVYYSLRGAFSVLYTPIFLYIFLNEKKYTEDELKHCFICFFIIYLVIYAYSYLVFPDMPFGMNENEMEKIEKDFAQRGVLRLYIPFEDLIALGIFYFINNPLKNRRHNMIVLVVLLLLTLLRGTRTVMAMTLVFGGLLFLKKSTKKTTMSTRLIRGVEIAAIAICIFLAFKFTGLSQMFSSYAEISANDLDSGEDYIRVVMAGFYLLQYNNSIGEYIFGHGIPVSGDFQRDVANNAEVGLYPDDVGYVEMFLNFGIVGILILVWILVAVISRKVKPECWYAKYYVYYLYVVSFMGRYMLFNLILFTAMLYVIKISSVHNEESNASLRHTS